MARRPAKLSTAIWRHDGREDVVQAPDTKTLSGNLPYDPELHEGRLVSARGLPVRLQDARSSSGGSSGPGARAHFVEAARMGKADFIGPPVPDSLKRKSKKPRIDRTAGYRIHINTADFTPEFNQRSGVYEISGGGRMVLADGYKYLRRMEPVRVRTIADMVDFIRHADPARLLKSEVIFQNNAQSWTDTFVTAGKPSRLLALKDRLKGYDRVGEPPFAVVEVKTVSPHDPNFTRKPVYDDDGRYARPWRGRWQRIPAPVEPVEIGTDVRGKPEYIQLGVYIDELADERTRQCMTAPDSYLVMGEARYRGSMHADRSVHYINVKVTDASAVMAVDMGELSQAVRHNAAKSEKRQLAAPSGP